MEDTIFDILEHVLSANVMIIMWSAVMIASFILAYKTKVYGVLVIAGGAAPFLIFYVYQRFGVWDVHPYAILYSRVAGISLCVSLMLGLWMMCRSIYNEPNRISDS